MVKFQQTHEPGRDASIDFTHANDLGVTIVGEVFDHLLFHFVLSFSGWTWLGLAFAETYEALVAGLQGALWELGGAPRVTRSDNLSAATHELRSGGRSLTKRFKAVLDHYGMTATRIRPGESHENGVAEKTHHLIKSALDQTLIIRGSRDFATVDEYVAFARRIVDAKRNRGIDADLAEELGCCGHVIAQMSPTVGAPVTRTPHCQGNVGRACNDLPWRSAGRARTYCRCPSQRTRPGFLPRAADTPSGGRDDQVTRLAVLFTGKSARGSRWAHRGCLPRES
jgi:hypothetical protein